MKQRLGGILAGLGLGAWIAAAASARGPAVMSVFILTGCALLLVGLGLIRSSD